MGLEKHNSGVSSYEGMAIGDDIESFDTADKVRDEIARLEAAASIAAETKQHPWDDGLSGAQDSARLKYFEEKLKELESKES